jgi:hypothetical protein
MVKFQMGLTGITRKTATEVIGNTLNIKSDYRGGTLHAYAIGDWSVFMDDKVEPQNETGETSGDMKVGVGFTDSNFEEASVVLEALQDTGAIMNSSCRLAVIVDDLNLTDNSKRNLMRIFEGKQKLIFDALGVHDGTIDIAKDAVTFRLFNSAFDIEKIRAYEQFSDLLNKFSSTLKTASTKQNGSDNPKFTMRIFLIRLGMIGDAYKATRKILLANLEGNSAFRNGKPKAEERVEETDSAEA